VLDDNGAATADKVAGFFFRETRYLSNLVLRLNGESPFRCSAAQINANRLEFTYIYPPVNLGAGGGSGSGGQSSWQGILRRGIDVRLACDVHPCWLDIFAELTSRWDERVKVVVEWVLGADYVDMPEAQSGAGSSRRPSRSRPMRTPCHFFTGTQSYHLRRASGWT
jgi:hypothetical protein